MNSSKAPVQTLAKILNPGTLSLGKCRMDEGEPAGLTQIFTLKKNGMDFVGQVRVCLEDPAIQIEVFNESYFAEFDKPKSTVLDNLSRKVLGQVLKNKELSETLKTLIHKHFSEQESRKQEKAEKISETTNEQGNERDLDKIFECLNKEYFNNQIQAQIMWGRNVKSRNKSGFRYGSYDKEKKLIRVHPRLKQSLVPLCVLELTVYHEMCHQFAPPYRRNGTWQSHHPEFKKKEQEHKNFKEARNWEKLNWHRLLLPSVENAEPVAASHPLQTPLISSKLVPHHENDQMLHSIRKAGSGQGKAF